MVQHLLADRHAIDNRSMTATQIADHKLFVRGEKHLFCISEKN